MAGIGAGLAALNIGARLTGVAGFFKRVPRWVWIALAIALAIVAVVVWHDRQIRAHDKALTAQVTADRDAQWNKRLAAERRAALAWKTRFDAEVAAKIKLQRKLNDEEARRIDADRNALRLRGPGQAAAPAGCRPVDHPGLAGLAGRHEPQPGTAANAGTQMPAGDGQDQWAVVPWNWLVDVVSERDAFRVEALGWRSRDAMLAEIWKRAQQQPAAQAPQPGTKGTTDGR